MRDKKKIVRYVIRGISWAVLLAAYIYVIWFVHTNAWKQIDADCSSEMYLAKILSEGNGIITTDWDYSTEIRVLGTQIITSFLFRFMDNWQLVRTVSSAIHIIIALASFFYLLKVMKVSKHFPLTALMILLPTSWIFLRIYTLNQGYYPHLIIMMTATALLFDKWNGKAKEIIRFCLIGILALLAGLGGPRLIVLYYFPMSLAMAFLFKSKREEISLTAYCAWGAFACNAVGTLINMKVLPEYFRVQDFTQLSFRFFDMEVLGDNINYLIRTLGYVEGELNWRIGLYNLSFAVIFLMSVFAAYLGFKSSDILSKIMSSYIVTAIAFYFLIQIFMLRDTVDRYIIPISVMLLPMCVCNIVRCLPVNDKVTTRRVVIEMLTVLVAVVSFIRIYEFRDVDYAIKWREAAQYLVDNGIRNGYATFWNANNIVEYSNGYCDMYHWGSSDLIDVYDPASLRHWLQPASHFEKFPNGRVAVVITEGEYENCSIKYALDQVGPAFKYDDLCVYVFDDTETIKAYENQYVSED
ncbi:MAG: hypothetical protein J6Z43_05495 [Clostridiales bacterium]|nr:hypothetical protein [Clostridiales bacterium]